ncbi:tyrosine-type recombinase/integrase [uncultured Clostridium sp.]|uniref:tyrosine-type recombinase/integrase n=1 Tax=uncultured Clostridium sp. TaxID=59620 RepID=UPI0028F132FD|nr:tyrosine-type recombinase/integrase [uncultured Clostridium sp.]
MKTKNSNRSVPIPPETLETLKQYKKSIAVLNIDNRITPYNRTSIKRYLNPILNKLANISIHELRHTYATLLIANGIDFKTAAKFLGHDAQQTIKTYSHVTDEMKKKATDTISKIFSK